MAIATPTVVRIQDQHDAPVLGAGQDGYALTWDNATGAFVASRHLLASGATPGATSQAQPFTNGITLDGLKLTGNYPAQKVFCVNADINVIEAGTNTNVIGGGGNNPGYNLIGTTGKPYYEGETVPGWGDDTGYVALSANVAVIAGGYDNIVNQLAGSILGGGHNFVRYSIHGHSVVGGGSYNMVQSGRSGIFCGTANAIVDDSKVFSCILGGNYNTITGSRSTILGGASNTITGSYGLAFGSKATISADGCAAFADGSGTGLTVDSANVFGAYYTGGYRLGGGNMVIGATAAAASTKLEVVNGTTNQLRLSYTAGSKYSNFYTDSSGYLNISTTGGRVACSSVLRISEIWDNTANLTLTTSGASRNIIIKTNDASGNIQIQPSNTGYVGIGTASPASRLHVRQDSTSGATPVLTLEQLDVSEEFVRFVGESAAPGTGRSLVDAADHSTPGSIVGWIRIYVQDDQDTGPITDGVYFVPFYTEPTA